MITGRERECCTADEWAVQSGDAAAMGIEQATVKAHLGRMLRKTRAKNRVELTLRAMEEKPKTRSKLLTAGRFWGNCWGN